MNSTAIERGAAPGFNGVHGDVCNPRQSPTKVPQSLALEQSLREKMMDRGRHARAFAASRQPANLEIEHDACVQAVPASSSSSSKASSQQVRSSDDRNTAVAAPASFC